MNGSNVNFGTEKLARLRKVLLHSPHEAIAAVTSANYEYHLFNFVPNTDQYLKEHEQYSQLLKTLSVEVIQIKDVVSKTRNLLSKLPNLAYLHDIAVITSSGAILSEMCPGTRAGEEQVVKEALTNLGIPIFHEFQSFEQFEGCLILSPKTLIIVETERHDRDTIRCFFAKALEIFEEIIYVIAPKARRFMHADMIFNRVSEDLVLYFPSAFLQTYLITKQNQATIDIKSFLGSRNIELIAISDLEQQNWGCSFVPLEPKVLIQYDMALSSLTKKKLQQRGVELIEFHPQALLAGGGSLRCLTLRLWRSPE